MTNSTCANITSMGESIFFLVSKLASRLLLRLSGYVIRTVNEALSYWLTQGPLCVQGKEPFTEGAEPGNKLCFIYAES